METLLFPNHLMELISEAGAIFVDVWFSVLYNKLQRANLL